MPKTRLLTDLYSSNRRWTVDEARVVLATQVASGLSVAAFSAREGIDAQRLYFWRRRVEGDSIQTPAPAFIEVRRTTGREPIEIVLRSGRVIRVGESIDAEILCRLVCALEQDIGC